MYKKIFLCVSLSVVLFGTSCVDKIGANDLNPIFPTGVADKEDDDDPNGGSNNEKDGFPIFQGGTLAFPSAEGYGKNAVGGRGGGSLPCNKLK